MVFSEFDGDFFVSYIDISGFKSHMKEGFEIAKNLLLSFYDIGYQSLRKEYGVEGIFISDCAIIFPRRSETNIEEIKKLLRVIKEINQKMLEKGYLLTASIAYGRFFFKEMNSYSGVENLPVYGDAYLKAYLDNEVQMPKLSPGFCRVVKDGLPENIIHFLEGNNLKYIDSIGIAENFGDHFYIYWMLKDNLVNDLRKSYKEAKEYPYLAYRNILQRYTQN